MALQSTVYKGNSGPLSAPSYETWLKQQYLEYNILCYTCMHACILKNSYLCTYIPVLSINDKISLWTTVTVVSWVWEDCRIVLQYIESCHSGQQEVTYYCFTFSSTYFYVIWYMSTYLCFYSNIKKNKKTCRHHFQTASTVDSIRWIPSKTQVRKSLKKG